MLGDLLCAIFIHRTPLFVEHTDNAVKRAQYIKRTRFIHAADPDDYFLRFQEGVRVQVRASVGPNVSLKNVVKMRKKPARF